MKRKKKFIPYEGYSIFNVKEADTKVEETTMPLSTKKSVTYKWVKPKPKWVSE